MTADRPSGRRLRADAQRNLALVLDAAESVFAVHGVAAPMEDIAKAAGVGVGTVYRHFPSKEALFEAIVVARMGRLVDRARALSAAGHPDSALLEVIDSVVADATVKKHFGDALLAVGIDLKSSGRMAAAAESLRAALSELLIAAQRVKVVREDIDIIELLAVLYGLCSAAEHYGWDAARRKRALTLAFDGLRPR
ncbi:helix-turn-helix domain-containing protein [Nonomuraea sp. B12E4]|uniref:TetR/AcrR family transcriptional regulator n=1 Tax=Nonomuraea sp. B12E4 TaxID=3153564 RepID=UPI00325FB340